ncbi:unnamed protein product [Heligmosomoides polygyrus]|uniref:Alpha-1,6-mannosyl-glycoprotein 6-beta-N-acetylglucosaminyltransferase n=1 Tax=Heligmosomoides polygyrus TaxID=6339 RepID=A0A3P7YGQ5_HELPZ|nr:unnamed protein product [Heligmosomoides polygyrus]
MCRNLFNCGRTTSWIKFVIAQDEKPISYEHHERKLQWLPVDGRPQPVFKDEGSAERSCSHSSFPQMAAFTMTSCLREDPNRLYRYRYHHGPCAQGYNFVPIVFGLMLYIVYVMECWHSRSKLATMKKVSVEDALQYLKSLRNSLPIVWWKSVCYHYVRKTRQVTRYRNGDAVPATQVYYERVDSHSAGNVFIYDVCGVNDISKAVVDLERFPLTRVRVTRGFVFACMQAAREFEQQRTRFFNENETRDDYMEVREGMDLSDVSILEDMLVFRGTPPWFLRASIFCPSSVNYTGPLTRTSTMETVELEAALGREQYFVVPSYSEAMLMPHAAVVSGVSCFSMNRSMPAG